LDERVTFSWAQRIMPELAILSRLDLADFSRSRLAVRRHVSNACFFFFFFSGLIPSGYGVTDVCQCGVVVVK
jgi:hypothetical protein